MRLSRIKPCLLALAFAAGISNSHALSLTTPEQENKLGEDAYKEILKKEKLCKDKAVVDFVERVAKRICDAAPDKGFKYEISVLDAPTVNAFCLPGGKICVYTGILPYCENEAGLACVMGHEVAHAILRHGGQRMTQGAMVNVVGAGLEKLLEFKGASGTAETVTMGAYNYASQLGILLPYSRSHEIEADMDGVLYMAKAGYDPAESVAFWRRFAAVKSNVPTFLSTHPGHEDRAARLEKVLPRVNKIYEQSAKLGLGAGVPASVAGKPSEQKTETKTGETAVGGKEPAKTDSPKVSTPKETTNKISIESLATDEIKQGLQTALKRGVKTAIKQLGKDDGFFMDLAVKLVMPDELKNVEKVVRAVGKEKTADDFIKQMNRAAEEAVPGTTEILTDAIVNMTIDDARSILSGQKDAATQYFKKSCRASMEKQILPIVQKSTESVGATSSYKNFIKRGGFAAKALVGDFDLDEYVTTKAVDGLFLKIADEEARIRENPAGLSNDLLRKVFGAVLK